MSDGVEHTRAGGDARYWGKRWHWIADALVACGISNIDQATYEERKRALLTEGWPAPQAATIAFNLGLQDLESVSACEVNPW